MGELVQNITSSIVKKSLMAVSGLALSGFLIVHAAGNSTSFFGKDAFDAYARHLHSFDAVLPIFEAGLAFFFILHVFLAVTLYVENLSARPVSYQVDKSAGGRTWGSKTLPYTGLIIFIFIIVHLKNFTFSSVTPTSFMVKSALSKPLLASFYIFSLIALCLHISHGFWSMFQTFGLTNPKYNNCAAKTALLLTAIIGAVFILIALLCLILEQFLA